MIGVERLQKIFPAKVIVAIDVFSKVRIRIFLQKYAALLIALPGLLN